MNRTFAAGMLCFATSLLFAQDKIPHIGPAGEMKTLRDDFQFTEGPTADGQGNLYFTDIPANRIYKLDKEGKIDIFLEPSNHCNGLMFNGAGKLFACEMDGRLIAIDLGTKKVEALAAEFNGKRFNAPNDLVIDSVGGVYFTDPHFRAPMPLPQEKTAVYYRDAAGKVTPLMDDLKAAERRDFVPDEKTLYVIPSMQKEMMAYPVTAPGKVGEGKVFCTLQQNPNEDNRGGDGLTVDVKGNLYITSATGIQVYDPQGKLLGTLKFPHKPANCTFGGPESKTLYVTAVEGLYAVPMHVAGHVFAKK